MNSLAKAKILGLSVAAACLTAASVTADVPPIPETPTPVTDIVSIQPFELDQDFVHFWRDEKPSYHAGYVLVLKVNPDLVYARQIAQPVLYVGNQTAEHVNIGNKSGYLVAIVPGVIDDPKHEDYIDLSKSMMWFGTPMLPEQVDARTIADETRLAKQAGIKAFPAEKLAAALTKGGQPLVLSSKLALHRETMFSVREYSPQEQALIDSVLHTTTTAP